MTKKNTNKAAGKPKWFLCMACSRGARLACEGKGCANQKGSSFKAFRGGKNRWDKITGHEGWWMHYNLPRAHEPQVSREERRRMGK